MTDTEHKAYITDKAKKVMSERAEMIRDLQGQLDELQIQYDQVAPTTPTGTLDWYVKWAATLLAVSGVFLISSNLVVYGQISYILSSICWIFVGMSWGDRAIMIGSSISGTAVAMNLVQGLIP